MTTRKLLTNGKRKYQQSAAYIQMLNIGLRIGETLGLLNSGIDLENRVMHLNRGVKEISKRDGTTAEKGREVNVGKLKSATSKKRCSAQQYSNIYDTRLKK